MASGVVGAAVMRAILTPKKAESHSRISQGAGAGLFMRVNDGPYGIAGPVHGSEVHARQVLADDSQCEELGTRKDRDNGGEKRKAGDDASGNELTDHDVGENEQAEKRATESHETCQLQRNGREPGRHVDGVKD